MSAYRIIRLEAENIKGIRAVEITPPEGLVRITGENGQGKSSVLDAIEMALGGMRHAPGQPLRQGEDKGMVEIDCGEFIARRTFTEKGSQLKISPKDGDLGNTPQEFLNNLLGKLGFDPLEFARMQPAEQHDTLIGMVDLDLDLEEWASERTELYEKRRELNHRLRDMQGQMTAMPVPDPGLPEKEIGIDDLVAKVQGVNETLLNNRIKREKLHQKRAEQAELDLEIQKKANLLRELDLQLEKMNGDRIELNHDIDHLEHEAETLVDPDVNAIKSEIQQAETINRQIRQRTEFLDLMTSIEVEQVGVDKLTKAICDHDERRLIALSKAQFPVDGLTLRDYSTDRTSHRHVAFQDVPFEQLSDSEKLRVSLGIAMAMNPELRVILIRDGSLLDSRSMRIAEEMAETGGYQVWIESVDESGKVGIVIEDGMVKADHYQEVPRVAV